MKIGFFAIGIGPAADPEVVALSAQTAEQCGFYSIWAPEHVVLLDHAGTGRPGRTRRDFAGKRIAHGGDLVGCGGHDASRLVALVFLAGVLVEGFA